MVHRRALIIFIMLALLTIVSCSSDDDNGVNNEEELGKPPAEMVGTWIFQSVTVDGVAAPLDSVMDWHAGAVEANFYIEAIGTYAFQEVNSSGGQLWSESGFVFVDGNNVEINLLHNSNGTTSEEIPFTFTINGNTMTLTEIDAGKTIIFTITKM